MDSSITINTHSYGLSRQEPTRNDRTATVGGDTFTASAGYQLQKQNGESVVRSVRKIAIPITFTENGVTRKVEGSASLVYVVPVGATNAQIAPARDELMSWAGQEGFLASIVSRQI